MSKFLEVKYVLGGVVILGVGYMIYRGPAGLIEDLLRGIGGAGLNILKDAGEGLLHLGEKGIVEGNKALDKMTHGALGTIEDTLGIGPGKGSVYDQAQRVVTVGALSNPVTAPVAVAAAGINAAVSKQKQKELKSCGKESGALNKIKCGVTTFFGFQKGSKKAQSEAIANEVRKGAITTLVIAGVTTNLNPNAIKANSKPKTESKPKTLEGAMDSLTKNLEKSLQNVKWNLNLPPNTKYVPTVQK